MNNVLIAQIIGTVSVFLLFSIKLYIVANPIAWAKSGRVAVLWTIVYVFFLFIIRFIQLFGIGSVDDLRIISGFISAIPVVAVCSHLFLLRNEATPMDQQDMLESARHILADAKRAKRQAVEALSKAKTVKEKQPKSAL